VGPQRNANKADQKFAVKRRLIAIWWQDLKHFEPHNNPSKIRCPIGAVGNGRLVIKYF